MKEISHGQAATVESLKPDWFIIENVPRMKHTVIRNDEGEYVNIIDFVKDRLGVHDYVVREKNVDSWTMVCLIDESV